MHVLKLHAFLCNYLMGLLGTLTGVTKPPCVAGGVTLPYLPFKVNLCMAALSLSLYILAASGKFFTLIFMMQHVIK